MLSDCLDSMDMDLALSCLLHTRFLATMDCLKTFFICKITKLMTNNDLNLIKCMLAITEYKIVNIIESTKCKY